MIKTRLRQWETPIVLLLGLFVAFINGIPFYGRYGLSQFVAVIDFLHGRIPKVSDLYMNHIFDYMLNLPVIKFSAFLIRTLDIESYQIDHLYDVVFTFLAWSGAYFLLKENRFSPVKSFIFATWFTILNPLRNYIYGYQYEVGRGSASLGAIAFALMTFLVYLLFSKKRYGHALFLAILFAVHPLNTFLYMGFVGSSIFIWALFHKKGERFEMLKENIPSLALLTLFLVKAGLQYGGIYQENPEKLFHLISVVNGFGERGGFFFSWMNWDKVIDFWSFTPAFILLFVGAWRKGYIQERLFYFSASLAFFTLFACLINYIAYHFKVYSLLPLDLSRIFALQMPLAFICLMKVLTERYHEEGGKEISLIGLLLTACLPQIPLLIPLLVLFALYGRRERLVSYGLILSVALILMTLFEVREGSLSFSELSLQTQRMKYGLFLTTSLLMGILLIPRIKHRVGLIAALIALLVVTHGYHQEFLPVLTRNQKDDRYYGELESYLKNHSSKDDIVLIEDTVFGYMGIRPHFINYNSLAYGIYMGNLDQLEEEARLIWDISFDANFVDRSFDRGYSNRRDVGQHMKKTLLSYTPEKIQSIRRLYPNFRFIAMEEDDQFLRGDLPVEEVFANERFHLYKVKESPI